MLRHEGVGGVEELKKGTGCDTSWWEREMRFNDAFSLIFLGDLTDSLLFCNGFLVKMT